MPPPYSRRACLEAVRARERTIILQQCIGVRSDEALIGRFEQLLQRGSDYGDCRQRFLQVFTVSLAGLVCSSGIALKFTRVGLAQTLGADRGISGLLSLCFSGWIARDSSDFSWFHLLRWTWGNR